MQTWRCQLVTSRYPIHLAFMALLMSCPRIKRAHYQAKCPYSPFMALLGCCPLVLR